MCLARSRATIGEEHNVIAKKQMLHSWSDFRFEDLLLRTLLLIYAGKLETVLFGEILGVGDFEKTAPAAIFRTGAADDNIVFSFRFEEWTDAGDYPHTHFENEPGL